MDRLDLETVVATALAAEAVLEGHGADKEKASLDWERPAGFGGAFEDGRRVQEQAQDGRLPNFARAKGRQEAASREEPRRDVDLSR